MLVTNSTGYSGLNLWDEASGANDNLSYLITSPLISANASTATSVPDTANGFHCKAFTLGAGGGDTDHVYIDGNEPANYISQGASAGVQTSGNFFLGSDNAGPWTSANYAGTFYRARFYPTELTAAQVKNTCAGMVAEVASRGVATGPVPVQLAAPQLNAIGDSITYGQGVSNAYPTLLSLSNQPAYHVVNWGTPSVTIEAMAAGELYRVAQLCRSSSGPVVASVLAGTNDILKNGAASAALLVGYLQDEVQELKSAGCRVYVGTLVSGGQNAAAGGTFDAAAEAYNALLLEQYRAMNADGVIDFAANPLVGAAGAATNPIYFQSDQTHPTQAGQALMAAAMSNALNYGFGYNDVNPHAVVSLPYSMTAGDGAVSTGGVTAAGTLTLPDCTGQSGAVYRINNSQSTYAVTVKALNAAQLINGLAFATVVTVPANGSLMLRDVPNAKAVSGCHWEY
jgi:lysophospholipase L1-like esterase